MQLPGDVAASVAGLTDDVELDPNQFFKQV